MIAPQIFYMCSTYRELWQFEQSYYERQSWCKYYEFDAIPLTPGRKKENSLLTLIYIFNILAIILWNVKIRNVELPLVRSICGRLPFVYRELQQVTYFRSAELQFTRNASFLNYNWKSRYSAIDTGKTAQLRITACGKEKKRERETPGRIPRE